MSPTATVPAYAAPTPVFPPPDDMPWRFSVDQYHQMIDAGILDADDPVELLDGCVVQKMPKYPLHSIVTQGLLNWFKSKLPAGYSADAQEPITLATSEPEPDVSVIRGARRELKNRHPGPAETAQITEVSDSTLRRDRGWKKRVYAQANIPQYWIVNLVDRQIEVYLEPDLAAGDYRQMTAYGLKDAIAVAINGVSIGTLRLEELLPAE